MRQLKTIPAYAAAIAGVLFTARYIYHLFEGTLHYQAQKPAFFLQSFFIVQLLMITALIGLSKSFNNASKLKRLIPLACGGLFWIALTRTIEAYGAGGPWGLYGSPGLVAFCVATLMAGIRINKANPSRVEEKTLITIAVFQIIGSFGSLVFYNLLGAGAAANKVASIILQLAMIGEGIAWVRLGKTMLRTADTTSEKSLSLVGRSVPKD
jgi:hypothetical protein